VGWRAAGCVGADLIVLATVTVIAIWGISCLQEGCWLIVFVCFFLFLLLLLPFGVSPATGEVLIVCLFCGGKQGEKQKKTPKKPKKTKKHMHPRQRSRCWCEGVLTKGEKQKKNGTCKIGGTAGD
jgi:hypothetical protein